METLTLKTKKRVFPSRGRVRLHESRLNDLKIINGDHVDLVNETAKKTVTVTVIADTVVGRDEIRVSEEDLKSLGLKEGEEVSIKKSLGIKEKVSKTAGDVSTGAKKVGGDVATGAKKVGSGVATGAKKAGAAVGKAAGGAADTVKKKVKGKDDL
jgi:predicted DNA-binding antitoxin AbrB/MazE fold protein